MLFSDVLLHINCNTKHNTTVLTVKSHVDAGGTVTLQVVGNLNFQARR